ncbi:MAG TPA: SDR family NAD(P)-dependent oxidoreductase [Ktedonobacteraceae bacterium]|nr:SDR family NAD(P)-dependent oxidoreductase [Ktedonobacteraceae bacterium]
MNTTPKVALVTGASSGFGQATAALLTAQGFLVFGTSRAPAHNEAFNFELLALDVDSEASVQTCVQTILERTGRIDLLVNNAGFAQGGALEENSLEDARAQFDTNVFGVLRMLKAVLPVMRQRGSGQIITVSSLLGVVAMPYLGLYASSKFALEGMIEGLYHELRPFHIKVSLVEPTFFRTKFDAQPPATPLAAYESARQSMMQFVREAVEQGPDPEQVARRIVQLATSVDPPLRSSVGPRAHLLVAMRHWLPQRIFEQLRRRVFQIERVPGFDGKAQPVRN